VRVVREVPELRDAILERRRAGDAVGFVPTMGFLHEGKLSLVRRARGENGCVVASLFVNPLVFASRAEADRFPRDEPRDLTLLEQEQVDIAFVPSERTLLSPDAATRVSVSGLNTRLEGASRPGHLDGAVTILLKLLHLVGPARLYLGFKDAQQIVVVRRMLSDLFVNVEMVICPTVRETDGLALSALNAALSIEERHAATCLSTAVLAAQRAHDRGERSAEVLRARMTEAIDSEPRARIDYVSVADVETLVELERVVRPSLAMVAVRIGGTRLTDCVPLGWEVA
jgi:pantoate--beta-alanine ligase